jgi:ABC-type bacteriocin/lantibiotic exporter with double-glycine peptidase domain
MNINYIIIGAGAFLFLLGLFSGYMLGWRNGHLTGIAYAMKIWLSGIALAPNGEIAEYTREVIGKNAKKLQSVKDETMQQIEELRKSGLK